MCVWETRSVLTLLVLLNSKDFWTNTATRLTRASSIWPLWNSCAGDRSSSRRIKFDILCQIFSGMAWNKLVKCFVEGELLIDSLVKWTTCIVLPLNCCGAGLPWLCVFARKFQWITLPGSEEELYLCEKKEWNVMASNWILRSFEIYSSRPVNLLQYPHFFFLVLCFESRGDLIKFRWALRCYRFDSRLVCLD